MQLENSLFLAVGLLAGFLVCYYFNNRKIASLELQHQKQKEELLLQLKEKEEKWQNEIKITKENELTVLAYPWKEEQGDDGYLVDDRTVKIGYQYQLFVRGVPCFEPHIVVLENLHKKQVNPEKISKAYEQATAIIQAIAKKHPAIQVAAEFASSVIKPK